MDIAMLKRAAELAKMNIDGREESLMKDFAAMATYGESLNAAEAAPETEKTAAVLRPDEPRPGLDREAALRNAPRRENEYIAAPRAFD